MYEHKNISAQGIQIGGNPANMPVFALHKNNNPSIFAHSKYAAPLPPQASTSNPALNKLLESKNLLMLQGPIGPMFDRIAEWKRSHKSNCFRIALNAGDALHCRALSPSKFVGSLADWPRYLRNFIQANAIDTVLLFGQSRKYHVTAAQLCRALKITLLVMEEGYIRPGFITLELDGVNAHSSTLRKFSLADERESTTTRYLATGRNRFASVSWHAITYYSALFFCQSRFPSY